jgi:hypothetical protein
MKETTPQTKPVYCEFVRLELTISWNEIVSYDGMQALAPRIGMRGCPMVGKGGCPVSGEPGMRNWSPCPHFPKI